jgi:SAM-dependent methyltransferase
MIKKYYTKENFNKGEYTAAQIKRHALKRAKHRSTETYEHACKSLIPFLPEEFSKLEMICLGTRNNWERDVFKSLLKKVEVYSLDIAPASNADYIMDFNSFPSDWENKWDIIYSNSIDHSISPDDCFKEWVRILKPGGIMYTDWDTQNSEKVTPTAADCSIFSKEAVEKAIEESSPNIEILSKKDGRWLIKKREKQHG